jgi:hypothetical protein
MKQNIILDTSPLVAFIDKNDRFSRLMVCEKRIYPFGEPTTLCEYVEACSGSDREA